MVGEPALNPRIWGHMVANWSTGAAGRRTFFLLIPAYASGAESSRINALPRSPLGW